mmetsp:Transcript_52564/g.98615  ORF Transcript_52564/g.98615 Transcript_52564/m.98615 type:complete len:129 (-) Transcript_52564:186-572(-)
MCLPMRAWILGCFFLETAKLATGRPGYLDCSSECRDKLGEIDHGTWTSLCKPNDLNCESESDTCKQSLVQDMDGCPTSTTSTTSTVLKTKSLTFLDTTASKATPQMLSDTTCVVMLACWILLESGLCC